MAKKEYTCGRTNAAVKTRIAFIAERSLLVTNIYLKLKKKLVIMCVWRNRIMECGKTGKRESKRLRSGITEGCWKLVGKERNE